MESKSKFIQNPKSSQDDDDHEHGFDIPECLLHEILLPLPLKTIFMLKSVSKRWNALISTPIFFKSYVARKQIDSSILLPWTLLVRDPDKTQRTDLTPMSRLLSTEFLHDDQLTFSVADLHSKGPDYATHIVSASDGLLLCRTGGKGNDIAYTICNPITKQRIAIPYNFFDKDSHYTEGFVTKVDEASSKVVSFKVISLRIRYVLYSDDYDVVIYDSDIKKWTESKINFTNAIGIYSGKSVCLNGIVHWTCDFIDQWSHYLIAYDPYNHIENQYRLLKLPEVDRMSIAFDLLDVCKGNLQYAQVFGKSYCLELWVLENYDEGIFELKHSVMLQEISTTFELVPYCRPLAFHPFDSDIIFIFMGYKPEPFNLLLYDMKTRKLSNLPVITASTPYPNELLSFVLPLWPPTIDHLLT